MIKTENSVIKSITEGVTVVCSKSCPYTQRILFDLVTTIASLRWNRYLIDLTDPARKGR